ncbi:tyrosine-type recombinase/integrase [Mycobacterium simiae]|uniref:Tyrosine-type recombinase/integrase n=1 Tax=Mycobacterium simiae TaxID=1784 RepID=A0A5B1BLC0_MYCSI|nr:tyrosine-type recombinase/integrase [Mycobacterium simiae]KAA1248665.1 tyrosine-type recombinase/integrase [Mycobacterium simiae]
MSVAQALAPVPGAPAGEHVFAGGRIDHHVGRIAAVVDPAFLAEAGWDPARQILVFAPEHPLLGRRICRAEGCATTATAASGVCGSCRKRLIENGLDEFEVAALPPRERRSQRRGPECCRVPGCAREWLSLRSGLCSAHAEQKRRMPGVGFSAFLTHQTVKPLPLLPDCSVQACVRQRRHPAGLYCDAHQQRLRSLRKQDPGLDESCWQVTESAIGHGGEVSLRGLSPLVVAQLLAGLQQRCRINAVKTCDAVLRVLVNDIRAQRVASLADYTIGEDRDLEFTGLANCLTGHARRVLSTPETEVTQDEWDLAVFGHNGTLSFTAITQTWLREAAKRWAADDLPRRRVRSGRRTSAGMAVRHYIGCLARLSESLRMRTDRGEHPQALGRTDMEAFLHRLAYLESGGQISGDARIRACREVRIVLTRIRAMGLTRPGGIAAGLGEDFAIGQSDVPAEPEPGEPNRDLPPEIMAQLCAHLDRLTSPQMRTAVEMAIDTGRRPEEICALDFDCLTRDDDGLPVLIYDNHKANRPARRLPISEQTAAVVIAQQQRVRARYPHTEVGELKLLPTDRRNPGGRRAITAFSLAFAHRSWVDRMPLLHNADGIEYDKAKIVLYAYRHSYAQRHADAGVPVEVLRELMSHRKLETTSGYYRVGETRRREAVDRVTAMQFDRHGNRIWRQAQALLDSEHARRVVGEVAVPFGVCAEPSNVKAGGGACPFRFRCAGCDHFRTDVSYLPDLHAYLDDLLRTRERLLATTELDQWAHAEAMPSNEEIRRIRRLIDQISHGLDELEPEQRQQLQQAVTIARQHRSVTLGIPRTRNTLPDLRPERTT